MAYYQPGLAWFGFAALLVLMPDAKILLLTVSIVSAGSAIFAVYYTRGQHLAWLVFAAISALTLTTAMGV